MTKKQKELELIIKHLVADNHNLRSENSKLWKRVEKNLEKSDKKVEKLMLFMLFGNQMMLDEEEEPRDTSPVACLENEIRLKIESDPEHKTPKERLVKNLLSMLRNQRESKVMEDLLESYNCNQKRRRSKKTDSMRQAEIKAESEDELDEKLPTNTPEPPIEPQEKTPSLIDDVNLFLNVEVPPSDN
ncbi:MAG: hypothetical protein JST59_01580 [Actinobacteria bacterium]|nr:hypothetical protein [Actinomycetota bacterium]